METTSSSTTTTKSKGPGRLSHSISVCMARIHINSPCTNPNFQLKKLLVAVMGIIVLVSFVALIITAIIEPYMVGYNTYEPEVTSQVHYGIVIDCGSSGSRVYLYSWPTHSGNPHDLLNIQQVTDKNGDIVVKKAKPGLSSFADKPSEASDHISPLLDYVSSYIPEEKHAETPLYILATAGMRMISEKAQKQILNDLLTDIPKLYKFMVADNHFEIISGKLEGVYAWIAVNYALDKFAHGPGEHELISVRLPSEGANTPMHTRRRTIGMMDMGGGSVQIAFEVTNPKANIPKALTAEINLGCQDSDLDHTYRIYVTTFLEYGANSAISRFYDLLVKNANKNPNNKTILNPCLPKDMPLTKEVHGKKYDIKGTGEFSKCRKSLKTLLNLTIECKQDPCSMNGIHQPPIDYDRSKFYGFSEFWYSTEDVFGIGGPYLYSKFEHESEEFCGTSWSKLQQRYKKKLYPKADDDRFMNQCFKGAWLSTVVHEGFKFPYQYNHLINAQLIDNKDVQWTLGALLYRTRYLPLRDIEMLSSTTSRPASSIFNTEYLILLCFIVVLASIILYMKRLRLCPKNDMHKVPSLSYFMTPDDEPEMGVKNVKRSYYL